MTTGAAHWELLSRARAVDNQVNLLHHWLTQWLRSMLPLQALLETLKLDMLLGVILQLSSESLTFLELTIQCLSAWGEVVARADEGEEIVYAEVRFKSAMLPLLDLPSG